MKIEIKIISKILATFLGVFCLLVSFFYILPTDTHAVDDLTEGYGWGRKVVGTASTNTVKFFFFDAHTLAPLNPDNFTVNLFRPLYNPPLPSFFDWCDSACPNSFTYSGFANDNCWTVDAIARKSDYHRARMWHVTSAVDCVSFTGNTLLTINVYLTWDSDPYQIKVTYPGIEHYNAGHWINYLPGQYTIRSRPSFDRGASSLTTYWYECDSEGLRNCNVAGTFGPLSGPFPTLSTVNSTVAYRDGFIAFGAWNHDNTQAYETDNATGARVDRVPPTVTCSASASGTTINVTLLATDRSGATSDPFWAKGAGVAAGDVDVSTDGGVTWTNNGLPNGGDTLTSFSMVGNPGTTYNFRFRAKDATYDLSGNQNQWSSYCSSTAVEISPTPTPIPPTADYTLSWGGVSNPSINPGGSADYSIVVNPQCSPTWSGTLVVTILNPSITPNDGQISSALTSANNVSISCPANSGTISYRLTAASTTPAGNFYSPVRFTATSSVGNRTIDGTLTINAASASQWLQTTGGDVYSGGGINFSIPPPAGKYTSSYLLKVGTNILNNALSAVSWVIKGPPGGPDSSPPISYDNFFSQVGASNIKPLSCGNGGANLSPATLPEGIWLCSGPTTLATSGSPTTRTATVFVNGDLTIDTNLDYGGVVFFIVKGQIKIKSTVTQINALLYSDVGVDSSYDVP